MHRFLRAIGFSDLKKKEQLDELIKKMILKSSQSIQMEASFLK